MPLTYVADKDSYSSFSFLCTWERLFTLLGDRLALIIGQTSLADVR